MKTAIVFIFVVGVACMTVGFVGLSAQRPQTTAGDMFEQLGRCTIDVAIEKKYSKQLEARITELEQTVIDLQKEATVRAEGEAGGSHAK